MANKGKVSIIEEAKNYNNLINAIKFIKQNEVYVGISDATTIREEETRDEITNAELLFIHTNGSPINNIPPRPVIEPAVKNDSDRLSKMMKQAFNLALSGNKTAALDALKRTGMRAQNVCRAWFTNSENGWPPNSPAIAEAKRRKGAENPRPLIDTGELRKSITYFVRTLGGRVK